MESTIARVYDVLLLGPLYIYFSTFIENFELRIFVLLVGIFTVLYNLQNLLIFDFGIIDSKNGILPISEHGKTQIHRLYNILIMYPILFYANYITTKPQWLTVIIFIMNLTGLIYNSYHYIKLN